MTMSFEEYRAIKAVNWSTLKAMAVSPKQYRYALTHSTGDTVALRVGRAVHCLLLEPEEVRARYAIWDGERRGRGYAAFVAEHRSSEVLTRAEYDHAHAAATAVQSHPVAAAYLGNGATEQVLVWRDDATGMRCKCRVDELNGRLVEVKTTRFIEPRRFFADAARLGYHGQCAFYEDGVHATRTDADTPLSEPTIMIAVQNEAPYDVAVYEMPDEAVDAGRALYSRLLKRLRECRDRKRWPGVCESEPLRFTLPAWAELDADGGRPTITLGGVPLTEAQMLAHLEAT